MASAHCLIAASSATSAIQPTPPVSRATEWTRWSRSTSATRAPRAASSRQHAAPMPLAPPVTTATPDNVAPAIYAPPLALARMQQLNSSERAPSQRQIAAFHGFVQLDILDRVAKHDLPLVYDSCMARDAQTKMHVLLCQQHGDSHVMQLPQQFADAFDDDWRQALARLVEQQTDRVAHQRARNGEH